MKGTTVNVNSFWGLAGALVTVALVTTIVVNPGSATTAKAIGGSFADALRAAQGK